MEEAETEMISIGTGVCQAWSGKNFYDLRAFDEVGKTGFKTPASVGDDTGKLLFKVCDASFNMEPQFIKETNEKLPASCNGLKGTAFYVAGGDCKYSFPRATFSSSTSDGFSLSWKSKQSCAKDPAFTVDLAATCMNSPNTTDSTIAAYDKAKYGLNVISNANCSMKLEYHGEAACNQITVDLQSWMDIILPFAITIKITIGLLLTFSGANLIFQALATCIALSVSASIFMILYNIVIPY